MFDFDYRESFNSTEELKTELEAFFASNKPKTITHLQSYLRINWVDLLKQETINTEFKQLINAAKLYCEEWVINEGFLNDKSFARWYHDKFYGKEKEELDISLKIIDPFS